MVVINQRSYTNLHVHQYQPFTFFHFNFPLPVSISTVSNCPLYYYTSLEKRYRWSDISLIYGLLKVVQGPDTSISAEIIDIGLCLISLSLALQRYGIESLINRRGSKIEFKIC